MFSLCAAASWVGSHWFGAEGHLDASLVLISAHAFVSVFVCFGKGKENAMFGTATKIRSEWLNAIYLAFPVCGRGA